MKKLVAALILMFFILGGCDLDKATNDLNELIEKTSKEVMEVLSEEKSENESKHRAEVVRVIDGDTIIVKYKNTEEKVRFIGIDTPETVHPTKDIEPYGTEASNYTKLRLENQNIELELDIQEKDEYGRLLAYIWIGDEHFNLTLIEEGYATVSTWPPNVKYVEIYTEAQKKARENNIGLWEIQ